MDGNRANAEEKSRGSGPLFLYAAHGRAVADLYAERPALFLIVLEQATQPSSLSSVCGKGERRQHRYNPKERWTRCHTLSVPA